MREKTKYLSCLCCFLEGIFRDKEKNLTKLEFRSRCLNLMFCVKTQKESQKDNFFWFFFCFWEKLSKLKKQFEGFVVCKLVLLTH